MNLARRYRFILPLAVALVAGLAAFMVWKPARAAPTGLRTYTSPPLNLGSQSVRVTFLAPARWSEVIATTAGSRTAIVVGEPLPEERAAQDKANWTGDNISVKPVSTIPVGDATIVISYGGERPYRVAYRRPKHAGNWTIAYTNRNLAEFDATYRQICQSFRVVR